MLYNLNTMKNVQGSVLNKQEFPQNESLWAKMLVHLELEKKTYKINY